jgi:hypothetical protein
MRGDRLRGIPISPAEHQTHLTSMSSCQSAHYSSGFYFVSTGKAGLLGRITIHGTVSTTKLNDTWFHPLCVGSHRGNAMVQKQPQHVRLPERSDLARGKKEESAEELARPDARAASQDPTLRRNQPGKPREQNEN